MFRIFSDTVLPRWQTDLSVAVMHAFFRSFAKTFLTVYGCLVMGGRVETVPALAVTRYRSQGHT